jgi:hypothetical protein
MELTKEYFDEVVKNLASKQDVERVKEEIIFNVVDGVASIEDALDH